jgi:hypothetical protein
LFTSKVISFSPLTGDVFNDSIGFDLKIDDLSYILEGELAREFVLVWV